MNALFDPVQLLRQRARCAPRLSEHNFLIATAWHQLADRLSDIKRDFSDVLVLGPHALPDSLSKKITRPPTHCPALLENDVLPFETQTFDLVLSNFYLHTINDLRTLLLQIRHVLKPGGAFLTAFPGGKTLDELRNVLLQAETGLTGGAAPRVHPFLQLPQAAALMQSAGFILPVVDSEKIIVAYPALLLLLHDLRFMGEGNALAARSRKAPPRHLFSKTEKIYQDCHGKNNRLPATFEIVHLIGWAPE